MYHRQHSSNGDQMTPSTGRKVTRSPVLQSETFDAPYTATVRPPSPSVWLSPSRWPSSSSSSSTSSSTASMFSEPCSASSSCSVFSTPSSSSCPSSASASGSNFFLWIVFSCISSLFVSCVHLSMKKLSHSLHLLNRIYLCLINLCSNLNSYNKETVKITTNSVLNMISNVMMAIIHFAFIKASSSSSSSSSSPSSTKVLNMITCNTRHYVESIQVNVDDNINRLNANHMKCLSLNELTTKYNACSRFKCLFIIFSTLLAISPNIQVNAVRIYLEVPELIYQGEGYWLNCSYDLENEPLYSIKWFKKNYEKDKMEDGLSWAEFYRFIPNDDEIKKAFPMKGVKVDLEKSHLGNVYIVNGDSDSEGTYKCEVSADAPSFETVRELRDSRIYYFSPDQPTIREVKSEYGIDEWVDASCSISFARAHFKSMTRLTWFLNGESVPYSFIRTATRYRSTLAKQSDNDDDDDDSSSDDTSFSDTYPPPYPLFTSLTDYKHKNPGNNNSPGNVSDVESQSTLNIRFQVKPKHFINGIMKLKCTASSIPELYSRSSEQSISLQSARGPTSRFSSAAISSFLYKSINSLILCQFVVFYLARYLSTS